MVTTAQLYTVQVFTIYYQMAPSIKLYTLQASITGYQMDPAVHLYILHVLISGCQMALSVVHCTGLHNLIPIEIEKWPSGVRRGKWGQIGPNATKRDQTGPNWTERRQMGPNGVKQG